MEDASTAARVLLTQTVMLEISKEAFRNDRSQMLGGLFSQILTDRVVKKFERTDG